jgi:hypothetical protein
MMIPSETDEVNRSKVTAPPIRIPGIQLGSGNLGIVKRVVPGIGTPMSTPIIARIEMIQRDSFKVALNDRPHGASSRCVKTITDITPTAAMAKTGEFTRVIAKATAPEKIHHVSG